jgi:hypothetical protein
MGASVTGFRPRLSAVLTLEKQIRNDEISKISTTLYYI